MSEDGPVLFKAFGNPDNDEGEWVVYRKGEKDEPDIRFRVRQIPDKKDAQMQKRIQGRKQTIKFRKGISESDVDLDESSELAFERAKFALLDSENVNIKISDDDAATEATKMFGKPIKKGESVRVDGTWTDPVKDYVLGQANSVCTWVVVASNRQRMRSSEEEQALAGN